MRLYLIRHGETVDNIAQVYAGRRDSELTNHGFQQAARLGRHFRAIGVTFTHIFSSHLRRALKTAELIRDSQRSRCSVVDSSHPHLTIKSLQILVEQDFGSLEGKSFYQRTLNIRKTGKQTYQDLCGDGPEFQEVESKGSMAKRMDAFLNNHLLPLFDVGLEFGEPVVAIVSHGMILSTLWRRLLFRLPANSVVCSPELLATGKTIILEHLGGWSNTGYLELQMEKLEAELSPRQQSLPPKLSLHEQKGETDNALAGLPADLNALSVVVDSKVGATLEGRQMVPSSEPVILQGWTTTITVINCKEHLKGLKRTGGGVGSARHDDAQKVITRFFKRRKID